MKKVSAALAVLATGLVVLISLGYWASEGFSRLSRSIMPGMATSMSKSMEPYDLVFKFDVSALRPDGAGTADRSPEVAKWNLAVPEAFLWTEVGTNDAVEGRGGTNSFHSAWLSAVFDPMAGTFSPVVLSDPAASRSERFFITPTNGRASQVLSDADRCVRTDELLTTAPAQRRSTCDPDERTVRCEAFLSYNGWSVKIYVPKKYYYDSEYKYCGSVKDFLNVHTKSIDALRS